MHRRAIPAGSSSRRLATAASCQDSAGVAAGAGAEGGRVRKSMWVLGSGRRPGEVASRTSRALMHLRTCTPASGAPSLTLVALKTCAAAYVCARGCMRAHDHVLLGVCARLCGCVLAAGACVSRMWAMHSSASSMSCTKSQAQACFLLF